ncbi:MAG: oxygen-independent coproporphyrinogen III oxidase [Myxococcota bacterium]
MSTAGGIAGELPDLEQARRLIAKYDRPGPRYTSYPTAPVFSENFGEKEFRAALRRARDRELSLYIHIPFCERLCTYCACNRTITQDHSRGDEYLDGIELEAERLAQAIGGERRSIQLAVGGGTPTFLSADQLDRMCRILDARFPPFRGAERSVEVDPRVTTRGQLAVLAEHGFNRVSLGVQDFSPKVQRAVNRVQSVEETERLTQDARELGYQSVNFDLIYGLPFQTIDSFNRTLDEVLRIRPDRIAFFSYAHVTWIQKSQRGFENKDLPPAERKIAIMLYASQRFLDAGYVFLGLDHFARPDDELCRAATAGGLRRNFNGYTTQAGVDLVALGASAISELADAYAQSERDPERWAERLRAGGLATLRGWQLSDDDLKRKWLIQRLMCQGEISPESYLECFGEALEGRIPDLGPRLAPFAEDGLLEKEGDGFRVTPLGRLFLRVIAMSFDAYLSETDDSRPMYSRTV